MEIVNSVMHFDKTCYLRWLIGVPLHVKVYGIVLNIRTAKVLLEYLGS